ncbi:hypothetical protein [Listeria fleischmannii]|uniref:Uncharacterized protein n=1 Tax=Listeria fleischmannii FSL S10-1203 TaxID=1265822 RepID=W7DUY8_9LIST|nr:hypothetical protein [Listeria fleischmannii]EUJ59495.1 hypothetical protein MCOL2_05835 [Listeria fleischmannii FSL S10-1203]
MFLTRESENGINIHFEPPKQQVHILYKPIVGVKEAAYLADVSEATFREDHMKDTRLIEKAMFKEGNRYKFETEPLLEYLHLRACELRIKNGIYIS